jgi:TM2 domain-containing membrane protein YozV
VTGTLTLARARRARSGLRAWVPLVVALLLAPAVRAQTVAPTPPASAPAAPAPSASPEAASETASDTPSYLELAERLRSVNSYSACAVEALRYAYDHPADRARGFERAALCLSLAGRHDDARRLMLTLPAEGTPLDARGRLRICLAEVFLLDLGAPACPSLQQSAPADRFRELGAETQPMRAIRARHWAEARQELAALPPLAPTPPPDPTLSAWREQDREIIRRYDALPRKSPVLAAALSMVIPGLGRVYIGRWPDGLMSLLLIGTTGALAAQGFDAEGQGSVRGWILASVAALLYVGNVYGSAVGAIVQRHDAEDALMREVDGAYQRRLDP